MPVAMQAKLLRVLEEGEVERVGGDKPIRVNVRVLVATHRNLEDLVKQNAFRRDLFHRVYVFPSGCCRRCANALKISRSWWLILRGRSRRRMAGKKRFSHDAAIAELRRYSWPGNVRELRNVVERLVLLAEKDAVTVADVRLVLPAPSWHRSEHGPLLRRCQHWPGTLAERTEAFEKEVLLAEIRRHNFHMTNVARALGLERSHLYKKCQQLGNRFAILDVVRNKHRHPRSLPSLMNRP